MDEAIFETGIFIGGGVHQETKYYAMLNEYYVSSYSKFSNSLTLVKNRADAEYLGDKTIRDLANQFKDVKIIKVIATVEEVEADETDLIY